MAYIYILDGVEFPGPADDMPLTTTIKRNSNLNGYLVTADGTMTFFGDAYVYIKNKFYNEGYCSEITLQIIFECEGGDPVELYRGVIKQASIELDEHQCSVTTKVQDNSFYSYINNNKSQNVTPSQTGTKNGEPITPPTLYDVNMFDPATGNPVQTIKGYRVYDLLSHATSVITDNLVGFASDFFSNVDSDIFVSSGIALRVPGNSPSFVYTWDKIYSELSKQYNLSFFIELDTAGNPTLRMEPQDYFFGQSEGQTFTDIGSLKVSVDESKIYGTIRLGSNTLTEQQGTYTFVDTTPFYGFGADKFYPLGQCNLDSELDLTNEWIISDNVVQDCLFGLSSSYDDQPIMISCTNTDTGAFTTDAIPTDLNSTAPPYLYNIAFNNVNKANRFYGYLHGDLYDFFGVSTTIFRASKSQDEIFAVGASGTETPLNYVSSTGYTFRRCLAYPLCPADDFDDETSPGNYDLGGNYNNATYVYTAPVNGQYTFNANAFIDVLNSTVQVTDAACYVILHHYDSTVTTLKAQTTNGVVMPLFAGGSTVGSGSATFQMIAGDVVFASFDFVVEVTSPPTVQNYYRFKLREQSFFECTSENVISANSPTIVKIIRYTFQYPITHSNFRTILTDLTSVYSFTKWSETQQKFIERKGWIEEIRYNNKQGFAEIKLLTNNAINQE